MSVLLRPVALHDPQCPAHPDHRKPIAKCLGNRWCIEDLEAYVQASLNRSRRTYSVEEREELVAENMRICVELASRFDPHRDGYQQSGRLCGYISAFQPKKSEDAYHRLHPEHRLRADPTTGKRTYVYGEKAVSLEALVGEDPDREPALADRTHESDVLGRLGAALDERWRRKRAMILQVAEMLSDESSSTEIQRKLGLTAAHVQEAVQEIMLVADRIRSGE